MQPTVYSAITPVTLVLLIVHASMCCLVVKDNSFVIPTVPLGLLHFRNILGLLMLWHYQTMPRVLALTCRWCTTGNSCPSRRMVNVLSETIIYEDAVLMHYGGSC